MRALKTLVDEEWKFYLFILIALTIVIFSIVGIKGCVDKQDARYRAIKGTQADIRYYTNEASKSVKGKFITNIRVNEKSVDIVLDDNSIITIYGYDIDSEGSVVEHKTGVR